MKELYRADVDGLIEKWLKEDAEGVKRVDLGLAPPRKAGGRRRKETK